MNDVIPIIDYSLREKKPPDGIHRKSALACALEEVGVAIVINHPIEKELIDELFHVSEQFHQLPLEQKKRLKEPGLLRGYLHNPLSDPPCNAPVTDNSESGIEVFSYSNSYLAIGDTLDRQAALSSSFGGAQRWPTTLPRFKELALQYQQAMSAFSIEILTCLFAHVGVAWSEVAPYFTQPTTFLRFFQYCIEPLFPIGKELFNPHTDLGCLTLLLQRQKGGLQVELPGQGWVNVPVVPHSFVVHVGDMLTYLSNDIYLATKHRVVNLGGARERYSIPYFYDCNFDAVVSPLEQCVRYSGKSSLYPPVCYGERAQSIVDSSLYFTLNDVGS